MPEADQDHGRIAMAVTVAPGHLDQALDLALGEVLAIAACPGCYAGATRLSVILSPAPPAEGST
jgi:hypothetical protein